MDNWKEMDRIALEMTRLEIMYFNLSDEHRALITFLQYVAFRKPSWSEEDILHGITIADKKKKEVARWWEEQRNPHPLGACSFATVARFLGNQIIGVGVRVRRISLRYTMIVMMRIQISLMMIVTLAQRLVIVTLPQRIVMMTLAQRLMMLACVRRRMTLL